jgi:hypothetical protein
MQILLPIYLAGLWLPVWNAFDTAAPVWPLLLVLGLCGLIFLVWRRKK